MNDKNEKEQNGDGKNQQMAEGKNALEWTVFGLNLLLITVTLLYLGYKAYTHQSSPADVVVEYKLNPTSSSPYRYQIFVSNTGGETAENVLIELELMENDVVLEKAEIEIQYVPQSSQREGWVNFSTNPAEADSIVARVVSFKKPS